MILKSFEINKIDLKINHLILLYGKNEGYKKETLHTLIKDTAKISNYEEKEILDDEDKFIESIFVKTHTDMNMFIVRT